MSASRQRMFAYLGLFALLLTALSALQIGQMTGSLLFLILAVLTIAAGLYSLRLAYGEFVTETYTQPKPVTIYVNHHAAFAYAA